MEIGEEQKNEIFPCGSITARRNSPSAIGPKIMPKIIH